MRQQKEIMDEEKFRNYFSFLLEQKEKYADGFYEQIGYENLDVKENSYIDLMNEIIQTNTDVLSNKEKGEKLKNIKSKNLQSISEYMLDEYDKEYIIWSNYGRNLIEIYNAWLQKNNLVWKYDSPQWLMLPSIKLNTTNNVPLSLEEEKNIATNFCIEVREYLDDKSRLDYRHLQWLIETIEKYEHDNNIIQSILEYQNLIDALEEEIKNIFIKVDPQNQKKLQAFMLLIKNKKDTKFFINLNTYRQTIKNLQIKPNKKPPRGSFFIFLKSFSQSWYPSARFSLYDRMERGFWLPFRDMSELFFSAIFHQKYNPCPPRNHRAPILDQK